MESENYVISAIIVNYKKTFEHIASLNTKHFFKENNVYIFKAIEELYEHGVNIDINSIREKLKDMQVFDRCGGEVYLAQIIENYDGIESIKDNIDILTELGELRRILSIVRDKEQDIINRKDSEKIKNALVNAIYDNSLREKKDSDFISKGEIEKKRIQELKQRIKGITTGSGYKSIDNIFTYGFAEGQFIVITGRPRMGKSALKTNIIKNLCREGKAVLNISPEMGFGGEMDRLTSLISGVALEDIIKIKNWTSLENNRIITKQKKKLNKIKEATKEINSWDIHFLEGTVGLADIRNKVIRIKKNGNLDVIFIDLFDRISEIRDEVNKKPQVTAKAISFVDGLAKKYKCCVVALVQISRKAVMGSDKRPKLHHLKESGSYEEEAWTVLGVYRDYLYDDDIMQDNEMEVSFLKQRGGKTSIITLDWEPNCAAIYEKDENPVKDDDDFLN